MMSEAERINAIRIAAKSRFADANTKTEQLRRNITEFRARYEREIKKKFEDAAAAGDSSCDLTGFGSLAMLRAATDEISAMGFFPRHINCDGCLDAYTYREASGLRVSWKCPPYSVGLEE